MAPGRAARAGWPPAPRTSRPTPRPSAGMPSTSAGWRRRGSATRSWCRPGPESTRLVPGIRRTERRTTTGSSRCSRCRRRRRRCPPPFLSDGTTNVRVDKPADGDVRDPVEPGSASMSVTARSGTEIAGTVNYDPATRTATFRPVAGWVRSGRGCPGRRAPPMAARWAPCCRRQGRGRPGLVVRALRLAARRCGR